MIILNRELKGSILDIGGGGEGSSGALMVNRLLR